VRERSQRRRRHSPFSGSRPIPYWRPWDNVKSERSRGAPLGSVADDRYDYTAAVQNRSVRRVKTDQTRWSVSDDWPDEVPITEAEIEVSEAWFGELFDELFSTRH
jgi:hypothetical protein